jgi:hypothetical protein
VCIVGRNNDPANRDDEADGDSPSIDELLAFSSKGILTVYQDSADTPQCLEGPALNTSGSRLDPNPRPDDGVGNSQGTRGMRPGSPSLHIKQPPNPYADRPLILEDESDTPEPAQDAHTLDGVSIQRLERHVQKLVDAAQISFAERALLQDQKQMLTRMNNEAKVRRSTQSLVLGQGQGRVMSFEDIEVARAARAAKVIKGQGKRGRKRKSAALEADEPEVAEPEPEAAARAAKEAIKGRGK